MNIISNCCGGAEFYRLILKKEFPNPFMWSSMTPKDVITLIKNYNSINFKNFVIKESGLLKKSKTFKIVIDNKIDLHFIHHIYSIEDEVIKKEPNTVNVYWKYIDKYLNDKYVSRLDRMLKINEPPCFFLFCERNLLPFSIDDIKEINNIKTNFKIILISNKDLSNIKFRNNVKWINDDSHHLINVVKTRYKEILEFFK